MSTQFGIQGIIYLLLAYIAFFFFLKKKLISPSPPLPPFNSLEPCYLSTMPSGFEVFQELKHGQPSRSNSPIPDQRTYSVRKALQRSHSTIKQALKRSSSVRVSRYVPPWPAAPAEKEKVVVVHTASGASSESSGAAPHLDRALINSPIQPTSSERPFSYFPSPTDQPAFTEYEYFPSSFPVLEQSGGEAEMHSTPGYAVTSTPKTNNREWMANRRFSHDVGELDSSPISSSGESGSPVLIALRPLGNKWRRRRRSSCLSMSTSSSSPTSSTADDSGELRNELFPIHLYRKPRLPLRRGTFGSSITPEKNDDPIRAPAAFLPASTGLICNGNTTGKLQKGKSVAGESQLFEDQLEPISPRLFRSRRGSFQSPQPRTPDSIEALLARDSVPAACNPLNSSERSFVEQSTKLWLAARTYAAAQRYIAHLEQDIRSFAGTTDIADLEPKKLLPLLESLSQIEPSPDMKAIPGGGTIIKNTKWPACQAADPVRDAFSITRDSDGTVVLASSDFKELTGYSRDEKFPTYCKFADSKTAPRFRLEKKSQGAGGSGLSYILVLSTVLSRRNHDDVEEEESSGYTFHRCIDATEIMLEGVVAGTLPKIGIEGAGASTSVLESLEALNTLDSTWRLHHDGRTTGEDYYQGTIDGLKKVAEALEASFSEWLLITQDPQTGQYLPAYSSPALSYLVGSELKAYLGGECWRDVLSQLLWYVSLIPSVILYV